MLFSVLYSSIVGQAQIFMLVIFLLSYKWLLLKEMRC